MSPPVSAALWAAWLCLLLLLLAAASAQSENIVYAKLGGEVSLTPPPVTKPITSILWLVGQNMAMDWDEGANVTYHQFKERGHLNTTTGVMTIRGLTPSDADTYIPEINHVRANPIQLTLLSGVPVPTVTKSCDEEMTTCVLRCEGNTTGAEPVTYKWKSDGNVEQDSTQEVHVHKKDSLNIKEFSCEMENEVSGESSQPLANPFTPPEGLKISTGLVVFISLLLAVLLLVVVHRLKAGEWFFEKGSMPWEADFWQKTSPRNAAEANGATPTRQQGTNDEETPMT